MLLLFSTVVVPILATTAVTEGDSVEVCLELFDRSLITGTASVSLITVNPPTSSTVKCKNKNYVYQLTILAIPTSVSFKLAIY